MPYLAHDLSQNLSHNLSYEINGRQSALVRLAEMIYSNASDRILLATPTGYAPQMGLFAANNPAYCTFGGRKYTQIERSVQNICLRSSDLSHAAWTKGVAGDTVALSAQVDPLGGLTAYKLTPDATSGIHAIYQTSGGKAHNVFARANGYGFLFITEANGTGHTVNLSTGAIAAIGTPTTVCAATAAPNSYWHVKLYKPSGTMTLIKLGCTDTSATETFTGNGTSGIDLWQPQAYASMFYATSPISTAAAAVTRAADVLYIPAALRSRVYVPHSINVVPRYNNTQLALTSSKNYIEYFADSTCGYGINLGPDKKLHVEGESTLVATLAGAWGVCIYGTTAYLSSYSNKTISTVSVTGGTLTVIISGLSAGVTGIACDGTYVYYAIYSGGDAGIWRAGLDGSGQTKLTSSVNSPRGMTVNSTKVFWADFDTGKIKSYTIAGGAVTNEVTGLTNPASVRVDATNMYWADQTTGKISYRPLAGGATVDLVTGLTSPQGIAIDSTYIYWSTNGGSTYRALLSNGSGIVTVSSGTSALRGLSIDTYNLYMVDANLGFLYKIYKSPSASTALTWSDNATLTCKISRAAGTVQISGCTNGDQTMTGLVMPVTDGNVYMYCNESSLMQFDGLGSEPY
jgi:hypothetical protein